MKSKLNTRLSESIHAFFLFTLISLLIIPSFFSNDDNLRLVFYLLLSMVFLSGLTILFENRNHWYTGVIFGVIAFTVNWFSYSFKTSTFIRIIETPIFFVFFSILAYRMAVKVFKATQVTLNVILDSISGYFLLGIVGGLLCAFLHFIAPNSFHLGVNSESDLSSFLYFSFTTITTLGYGDFLPITPKSQALAIILVIMGQFYQTILVAMLIGKYLVSLERKEKK